MFPCILLVILSYIIWQNNLRNLFQGLNQFLHYSACSMFNSDIRSYILQFVFAKTKNKCENFPQSTKSVIQIYLSHVVLCMLYKISVYFKLMV
jgi:hypothetical protein